MSHPTPFTFREEEKPRFKLHTASVFALLMLLLLFWGLDDANVFQLSAEEIRLLEQQKLNQEREMTFRFMEEPEDPDFKEEAKFLSDANRRQKSQEQETEPENSDPTSIGNTLELQKAQQAEAQQESAAALTPPMPEIQQEPTEQTPDEPEEVEPIEEEVKEAEEAIEEHELEPVADAEKHAERVIEEARGNVPTDPGAPKPFRRLSKKEREAVRQRAQQEMKSANLRQALNQDSSFHNPKGSSAPFTGLSVETNRSDLGEYLKILKQLIRGNWRIPNIARYEVSGFAVVYFKINKDGRFADAMISTPSGYEPLDASSLNAVLNTYQAPPLPTFVEEEWVPIKFGFFYNMRPNY